jgi:hypothetical protein
VTSYLIDANLLVYATMPNAEEHEEARTWLQSAMTSADDIAGMSWSSLYAFVRLVSNRRIMGDDAVSVRTAWDSARVLIQQPTALIVAPGAGHAAIADELFATPGLAANDAPDVFLAGLAIERGLTLATHDHGFARFRGLRWMDPLR